MKKLLSFSLMALIAVTSVFVFGGIDLNPKITSVVPAKIELQEIPVVVESSLEEKKPVVAEKKEVLVLESKNTLMFKGVVTDQSVSQAMVELIKLSSSLPSSTPIYLILDTPGGSVFDGLDFIDFADALPQEVKTVTLFAASMGFQFAQSLGERLIQRNGTLMSHRAALNGLGGQMDGELETRYKMIKRKVDYLDHVASKRMEMELADYKALVLNEYWVHGFDAVKDKAADKQVLIKCGKSMTGTVKTKVNSMFGPLDVTWSKCPLVKYPLEIDFSRVNKKDLNKAKDLVEMIYRDKTRFISEILLKGKLSEYFKLKNQ